MCRHRRYIHLPHTCLHQIVWCHMFKYRRLYGLYCISSTSRLKKKKKKDRPTDPPNFQVKRANKTFTFLGPINSELTISFFLTFLLLSLSMPWWQWCDFYLRCATWGVWSWRTQTWRTICRTWGKRPWTTQTCRTICKTYRGKRSRTTHTCRTIHSHSVEVLSEKWSR